MRGVLVTCDGGSNMIKGKRELTSLLEEYFPPPAAATPEPAAQADGDSKVVDAEEQLRQAQLGSVPRMDAPMRGREGGATRQIADSEPEPEPEGIDCTYV